MKTPHWWHWRQTARWLKRRLGRRAAILMYHRVTELPNDPYLLAVTPKHFAEHLEVIAEYGTPISLQQLVRGLEEGRVPDGAVAVTFDDGYADNLDQAKPLLAQRGIPATVFLTAGQIGGRHEFWWDELDRLLLQPGHRPPKLRLTLDGRGYEWNIGEGSRYTERAYRRDRAWHVERPDDPTPRHTLFRALYEILYRLPTTDKRRILDQLAEWAAVDSVGRPTHRALTVEETVLLAQGGLVEVGAHTMTHPALAGLPAAEQRREILQSKAYLEQVTRAPVVSFAYPHGSSSPETTELVRAGGFAHACSSRVDAVSRVADPFQLPRLGVRDCDGSVFARWLRWWIGG